MAAPLSLDIRKRIVAAVEGRTSRRAAADRFAVSESTAIKLVQQWEQTGSLEPGRIGGYRPFALAAHEKLVRELIAQAPDQSLDELRDRWPVVASWSVVRRCNASPLWPFVCARAIGDIENSARFNCFGHRSRNFWNNERAWARAARQSLRFKKGFVIGL